MDCVEQIVEMLSHRASSMYFGEPVLQREHALQAAKLAVMEGAGDALVVAALLHDVGYLVSSNGARHEEDGSGWLGQYFGPDVTEPVRLHVLAKRYLCTVDPTYRRILSRASIRSLERQGGLLNKEEIHSFEMNSFHHDAISLRRWDDKAKVAGLPVPGPQHFAAALRRTCSGAL
jgi:gamma-butyrobetaine dioxygenase